MSDTHAAMDCPVFVERANQPCPWCCPAPPRSPLRAVRTALLVLLLTGFPAGSIVAGWTGSGGVFWSTVLLSVFVMIALCVVQSAIDNLEYAA